MAKHKDRMTERQMKQMFDFNDADLRDIRNGDVDFGYCEVCEMYFYGEVATQAIVNNQMSVIDSYCAKRIR